MRLKSLVYIKLCSFQTHIGVAKYSFSSYNNMHEYKTTIINGYIILYMNYYKKKILR